jgi:hypothetical protein
VHGCPLSVTVLLLPCRWLLAVYPVTLYLHAFVCRCLALLCIAGSCVLLATRASGTAFLLPRDLLLQCMHSWAYTQHC